MTTILEMSLETYGTMKLLKPSDKLMTTEIKYGHSLIDSLRWKLSLLPEEMALLKKSPRDAKNQILHLPQTSDNTAEVKRLIKKLEESVFKGQWLNATYYCTLLSLNIQKKHGTLRFSEREQK
jgi:hypothetical protein